MKILNNHYSRREFIKKNTLTGIGTALSIGMVPPLFARENPKRLDVKPRYHRWHVDPGVEWVEKNTSYANLEWSIPLSQTALVLVDVWQRHYLKDTEERAEKIIQKNLIPLLDSCRQFGMNVIHAPSPSVAKQHPNWVNLITPSESRKEDWPPPGFRNMEGNFKAYKRPIELREEERQNLPELTFHPDIQPHALEPVVANGEELHRYCKDKGILFLFFAGFNTNACILSRDYGTIQMSNRGYQVVLLRDCTTGMESAETHPTLAQTHAAILLLEMFGQYTLLSEEIIAGFSENAPNV